MPQKKRPKNMLAFHQPIGTWNTSALPILLCQSSVKSWTIIMFESCLELQIQPFHNGSLVKHPSIFSCNHLESSNWNNQKTKIVVSGSRCLYSDLFCTTVLFNMDGNDFFFRHQTNVVRSGSSNACSTFSGPTQKEKSTTKTSYYILDGKFVISQYEFVMN